MRMKCLAQGHNIEPLVRFEPDLAGHIGREKTLMSVRRNFFWPDMWADIRRWCKHCDACAQNKRGPGIVKVIDLYPGDPLSRGMVCPECSRTDKYSLYVPSFATATT